MCSRQSRHPHITTRSLVLPISLHRSTLPPNSPQHPIHSPPSSAPRILLELSCPLSLSSKEPSPPAWIQLRTPKLPRCQARMSRPSSPSALQSPLEIMSSKAQKRLEDTIASLPVKLSFVHNVEWPTGLYKDDHFICSLLLPPPCHGRRRFSIPLSKLFPTLHGVNPTSSPYSSYRCSFVDPQHPCQCPAEAVSVAEAPQH